MLRELRFMSGNLSSRNRIVFESLFLRVSVSLFAGILLSQYLTTSALALSYDESVSGDLPNYPFDAPAFVLNFGTNTFTGEQHFAYNAPPSADIFDSFAFTVPAGGILVSVTAETTLLPGGSGAFNSTLSQLQSAPYTGIETNTIPIPSSGLNLFSSSLPLGAGTYGMGDVGHIGAMVPGDSRAAAFTYTLVVLTPEPSSILLLSVGLLFASGRRRKA